MVSKDFVDKNKDGLHIRPAEILVNAMTKYTSRVILRINDKEINAKSMISLMIAGVKCGTPLTVECNGKDEEDALREASELIESGFGEE